MNKKRYKEEYEKDSEFLWHSEKEDKFTREFYKNLSNLSENTNKVENKKIKHFTASLYNTNRKSRFS